LFQNKTQIGLSKLYELSTTQKSQDKTLKDGEKKGTAVEGKTVQTNSNVETEGVLQDRHSTYSAHPKASRLPAEKRTQAIEREALNRRGKRGGRT